ncbi:hypothetical protein TRVL_03840 [Trypanosoma vivax]|nr:hypothetical protein TRVL_03840 [Trypanosoma vivax]
MKAADRAEGPCGKECFSNCVVFGTACDRTPACMVVAVVLSSQTRPLWSYMPRTLVASCEPGSRAFLHTAWPSCTLSARCLVHFVESRLPTHPHKCPFKH